MPNRLSGRWHPDCKQRVTSGHAFAADSNLLSFHSRSKENPPMNYEERDSLGIYVRGHVLEGKVP